MRLLNTALVASLFLAAPTAFAKDQGMHSMSGTHLSFSQEKTISSHPDLLTLSFNVESKAVTPAAAQEALNQRISKAVQTLKTHTDKLAGTEIQVQNYSVYKDYESKTKPRWVARQSLQIKAPLSDSKTSVKLLAAAGSLQSQSILLQDINWGLQDPTRAALTKQATEEALRELRATAESDASALGMKFKKFAHIGVNPSQSFRPRPVMMMARANTYEAPQATPSDVSVSVTIEASAVLEK